MDNVDDLLLGVVGTLLGLLGGGVGTGVCVLLVAQYWGRWGVMRTERFTTNGDLAAVGLVCYAIDLLDVIGVGDDLVVGDNILRTR